MKKALIALPVVAVMTLSGCAGMSTAEQRTLSGGAIGAATGAGISVLTDGNAAWGAVGGAAVGALGGFIYNKVEEDRR